MGLTLVFYVWATAGPRPTGLSVIAAAVAPTTTITIVAGQAGLLEAALLAGGFRLTATRPVMAGILFGLATYKPQMGVLVPVALAAARLWRTVAAACVTTVVLVLVTGLVFGSAIWPAWIANIIGYAEQFAAESSEILYLMPTVAAGLIRLGASAEMAQIAQLAAAVLAAALVWRCFRDGPGPLAAAVLFVATFLATPHAFVYDMPIVATAVLWFVAERCRSGDEFGTGEILAVVLAMLAPITLVAGGSGLPLVLLTLLGLLAAIVRRIELLRRSAAAADAEKLASA
jgi:hypothetical protein